MTLQYNAEDASWKESPESESDAIRYLNRRERPLWDEEECPPTPY